MSLKTLFAAFLLLISIDLFSQIKLPQLISDGVVLQRDAEVKLWGCASPNETIELTFKDDIYTTQSDGEGNWSIILPKQPAGGPFEMHFKGRNTITLRNVMFGDVWVCSGQSNMELTMERIKEKYSQIIKTSKNEYIRHFTVPDKYDFKLEHSDLDGGTWKSADPDNVLDFSAVAYFFAKELYEKYQVPIGLINAALGGSPIESWMSEDALKPFPAAYNELQKFKNDSLIAHIEASDKKRIYSWYSLLHQKDKGLITSTKWYEETMDDNDWEEMEIPGYWANHSIGDANGVVWFRKKIDVPASMIGKPAKLWLGRIVDQDYAYLNGYLFGTTSYQYPPRRYSVDPDLLKEGENILVIRIINQSGKGGFVLDKPYYLAAGEDTIDLKGKWKYKTGTVMEPLESQTFIRWKPAGLYNRMIAPLLNFNIKGVIWYQGESNTGNPSLYYKTFPAMIANWRKNWDQGDFPFIYVQLTNFMEVKDKPEESKWAELRNAQLKTLSVPNTGMAVAIDLGEWNDIHPLNKKDVGKRLALLAKKMAYNEKNINASGPIPAFADFLNDKVIITFKNPEVGIMAKGGDSLRHFAISNEGENFVWAKTEINGNRIIVWNEKIQNPTVVRYAWADNPQSANLYSKEGLPASPFEIKKEK